VLKLTGLIPNYLNNQFDTYKKRMFSSIKL